MRDILFDFKVINPPLPKHLIRIPFIPFTEEDILEMEKHGVERKEIEELNALMSEMNNG